jgi:hypothetical protein
VCRAANGDCDVAENCSGTSATCPANGFKTGGTQCRAADDDCDVAENCNGTSATCPTNGFKAGGTQCRAADGDCDVAENCNGTSAACPADRFKSESTVCRAATNGGCDVAENCLGDSGACPTDKFKPKDTSCRAAAGVCDKEELCTGASATCPADAFLTSVCRPASGACDVADSCDGRSANCPADAVHDKGFVCDETTSRCDDDAVCDGSSKTCPAAQDVCDDLSCVDGACVALVFVTSETLSGDLGGLDKADALCNELAKKAGFDGKFAAWLSTADTNASDRVGFGPFARVDGKPIADDVGDLIDSSLQNPISLDESGNDLSKEDAGKRLVWTGTNARGVGEDDTCKDWQTTDAQGVYGDLASTAGNWTQDKLTGCNAAYRMYCFQVGGTGK